MSGVKTQKKAKLAGICVAKSYTFSLTEVDAFVNTKGVFKSQLIDGINEVCYDILDDMLIEEDEDGYTLNEKYYKQIRC